MTRSVWLEDGEVPSPAAPPRKTVTSPWLDDGEVPHPSAPPRVSLLGSLIHVLSTVLAVGAVSVLVVVAAGPRFGLYRIETVLSGSMQPTLNPGDLIVVTPEPASDVKVGQVISYQIPIGDHHVESHRIVRVISGSSSGSGARSVTRR